MCHMSSQVEWDEEVESWSVDIGEEEEEVSNNSIMNDCVDGKEVNGDFEERVEEPKWEWNLTPTMKLICITQDLLKKRGLQWVSNVLLEHNNEQSPSKSRFFKSNRALDEKVRKKLVLNERAGIRLNKIVASLHIEAGRPDKVTYLPRNCQNYLDKLRRLQLAEGDAEAMHRYFMRMRGDNADFFYAMGLNDEGRLKNVFWTDARSTTSC
ncbi:far-red elongated hypocotyls 3 [Actinidia rufa]|uniref:Far-red elongated hypocotyls 3 n=1 Tax=Actinidia rufa TaxID=165716 RepID=A0A7J0DPD3_9ERIC|nr:far-red elongated hypocotyls 3 [Actinidia rufa]